MFHMGWFIGRGYSVHAWNQQWSGTIGTDYMQPDLYIDLVQAMERACFDYVMIEDGSFVPDAYKGSPEWYLHNAHTWRRVWVRPSITSPRAASASIS